MVPYQRRTGIPRSSTSAGRKNVLRSTLHYLASSHFSMMSIAAALTLGVFFALSKRTFQRTDGHGPHVFGVPRYIPGPFKTMNEHHNLNAKPQETTGSLGAGKIPDKWNSRTRAVFSHPRFAHSKISCDGEDENFPREESIKTGDCSTGLSCRARVVVSKANGKIEIKSGYHISSWKGKELEVDSDTKRKVEAVTLEESVKWAKALFRELTEVLKELKCPVTSDMIAQSIMVTKNAASKCPRTYDPSCSDLVTVKICPYDVPALETEEERGCRVSLQEDPPALSYSDLQTIPCHSHFFGNRLLIWAPICKIRCPSSSPCPPKPKLVFSFFVVKSHTTWYDGLDDCVSAVALQLYKAFRTTIPLCEDLEPSTPKGSNDIYLVQKEKGNVPKELQDLASEKGCELTSAYFSFSSSTAACPEASSQ